ncbi:uncharacterized protein LOC111234942 isoform X2 [Seriola dumerili]|uniref:uncharacterized protein LOC111234942 isoform X2 n=1 Tax=Seriola dumerili TaxID=41447 RepID=UPI000BBEA6F0|nr:uncharacterized protein LOC111234942 isoform X2 [Seriola dumerili]
MRVRHTLICCFFLTLQDVKTGLTNAETCVHTGTEGRNISITCAFFFSGWKKFFCNDECKKEDILIETEGNIGQKGRYKIEYEEGRFPFYFTFIYMTISQLTKSDSGQYSCGLVRSFLLDGYEEFEIRVTDAASDTTNQPETSPAAPNISPENKEESLHTGFFLVLVVCVSVVMVVVLLAVVLLLLYKKKMKDSCDLKTRRNSDHSNIECITYENCPPPSTCEDSTYMSLNPASRDRDQTYSTLTHIYT